MNSLSQNGSVRRVFVEVQQTNIGRWISNPPGNILLMVGWQGRSQSNHGNRLSKAFHKLPGLVVQSNTRH